MPMKKICLAIAVLLLSTPLVAQTEGNLKQHVFRVNFLNPGVEYEHSLSVRSKLSANIGYGVSMSYPELTSSQKNHAFFLSPFFDVHYKNIYNLNARKGSGKPTAYNAGDFWGIKVAGRYKNSGSHLVRTDNIDFAVGPTWGIQRSFNRVHMLVNLGPVYYFDTKGNGGFYPIMAEFNVGYNF